MANNMVSSQTIKIDRKVFWTDSSTLLSWLKFDQRKYHQFVAHRIGEIIENTDGSEWRWVPSKMNVADELTKWSKTPSFEQSDRWFHGPSFLYESEEKWPVQNSKSMEETNEEMKVTYTHSELIICPIFESERFSNWNRLVRAVAYAVRFIAILKSKIRKQPVKGSYLNKEELQHARNIIFRQAQFEGFPEEMVTLELNQISDEKDQIEIHKSSSLISCSPYLDENGVLRLRGRIDLAKNVSEDTKRLIILHRNNGITKLLVGHYHRIYHHRNHETVVNELRQKFYIPKLRVVLKSIVTNDCQKCKNRRAVPETPEMGDLPLGRLAVGFRPFTHTGLDYLGPFHVTQGRSTVKRWCALYTCLTIRAIHLEIAYSMDTQSCIKCLRNFISIRGKPSEIYSDNGTNFKGMDNELRRALEQVDMAKIAEVTACYTTWHFNPPTASHMGGVYERLVRSLKTILYDIMPTRHPNDESLRNLLMEVLNVINSRPLTYIPLDHENDEALTPNHFILGSSNGNKPPGEFQADGPFLRSQWKEMQRLTDIFWSRFIKEYIPTLTRQTKWFQPVKQLEIGDIVLVCDEKNVRNVYPKAKIIERVVGSKDQVRRVRIQFADGSALWRPACGVARLDISPKESSAVVPNSQTGGTVTKADVIRAKI